MTASGLLKHDPFITTPNAPGVFLAVFCTMTTYGLADERVRRTHLTCMSRKVVGTHPFPGHDTPSLTSPTTSFLAITPPLSHALAPVSYTHLTLPTIYSV